MGSGGSIGFGAAGPGTAPGPPVSARAFGAPFAPKAHFLTRRLAARPNEGDCCHCNGRLANPESFSGTSRVVVSHKTADTAMDIEESLGMIFGKHTILICR
jgi:hypothetical protein